MIGYVYRVESDRVLIVDARGNSFVGLLDEVTDPDLKFALQKLKKAYWAGDTSQATLNVQFELASSSYTLVTHQNQVRRMARVKNLSFALVHHTVADDEKTLTPTVPQPNPSPLAKLPRPRAEKSVTVPSNFTIPNQGADPRLSPLVPGTGTSTKPSKNAPKVAEPKAPDVPKPRKIREGYVYRVELGSVLIAGSDKTYLYCPLEQINDAELLVALKRMASIQVQKLDPIKVTFDLRQRDYLVFQKKLHVGAHNLQLDKALSGPASVEHPTPPVSKRLVATAPSKLGLGVNDTPWPTLPHAAQSTAVPSEQSGLEVAPESAPGSQENDRASAHRSKLKADQDELDLLQAQVEAAQQRLEALKTHTTEAIEQLCAKVKPAQQSLEETIRSVRLQLQEELDLAGRIQLLLSTSTAPLAQSIQTKSDNTWAGTSQEFAQSVLPSVAEPWATGLSSATWLRLHLAMLSCRLIQVQDAAWVKAYRQALGDSCVHYVLPVEPTWLAFQDPWSGGLEKIWTEALARPDRLTLVLLQDACASLVPGWVRPLLNLHLGISDHIVPGADCGWPENLRVLWTQGPYNSSTEMSSLLQSLSARVPAIPSKEPNKILPHDTTLSVSLAHWRSWSGLKLDVGACPVQIPSSAPGGRAFWSPQVCKLYVSALQAGLRPTEATQVIQEVLISCGGSTH